MWHRNGSFCGSAVLAWSKYAKIWCVCVVWEHLFSVTTYDLGVGLFFVITTSLYATATILSLRLLTCQWQHWSHCFVFTARTLLPHAKAVHHFWLTVRSLASEWAISRTPRTFIQASDSRISANLVLFRSRTTQKGGGNSRKSACVNAPHCPTTIGQKSDCSYCGLLGCDPM